MNTFDIDRIRSSTFVQDVEVHQQLESTNDYALARCAENNILVPGLIVAVRQTAGRGRDTNQWWAAEGALTFSLVVEPLHLGFDSAAWPRISLTTGLAVCQALARELSKTQVGLKWPNDVLLNGRKVCGVLIESRLHPVPRLVIGIGMNINNSVRNAPAELQATATSILDETDATVDLTDWLIALLCELDSQLTKLSEDPQAVVAAWRRLCVLTGHQIRVTAGANLTIGKCEGIDESGALLVRTDDGLQRIVSGTVERIS